MNNMSGIKGAHNYIIRDQMFFVNWSTDCGKINGSVTLVNETIEYNIVNTGLHVHAKKGTLAKTGKKYRWTIECQNIEF